MLIFKVIVRKMRRGGRYHQGIKKPGHTVLRPGFEKVFFKNI
jgi:hypothetical protein